MSRGHLAMFYEGLPFHHVLATGDYTFRGRWAMSYLCGTLRVCNCADCTMEASPYVFLLALRSHYQYFFGCFFFSHFLLFFPILQGGWAFASKVFHLRHPELTNLGEGLPLRAAKAKAPSTTEHYSRAFQKFREWCSGFDVVVCLPSDEMSVAFYLEFLLQTSPPFSTLESVCYGIIWA